MPRNTTILPLAAMEKLLKAAGVERVSEEAKEAMRQVLEDAGVDIGKKAWQFAIHAGRKTVKAQDIKLAER